MMNRLLVAMVDDASLYSKKLIEGYSQLGARCVLYGPLSAISSKSPKIMVGLGPEAVRVWSQNMFPFQVLKRAVRDKPDLVHVQFEFYGIHSYGPIYASIGLPILLILLRVARLSTLVTLHSVLPSTSGQLSQVRDTSPNAKGFPTVLLEAFLLLSYKLVGSFANGILVHARVFKRRLIEQYHVRPSKIVVVPHGVDPWDRASPKEQSSGSIQNPILYFGVISPRKGIENLLRAFALLTRRRPDCELLLAGSSPPYYPGYESKLRDRALRLGLGQKIHFLGAVDNTLAHKLFEQARFVILPYSYNVSASGVLSWAIGHGVPVIVSDNEYFREELSPRQFGLMVTPGKPEPLAEAMESLLTEEKLHASLSQSAREAGLSRTWNTVASETMQYYQTMISHNGFKTTAIAHH